MCRDTLNDAKHAVAAGELDDVVQRNAEIGPGRRNGLHWAARAASHTSEALKPRGHHTWTVTQAIAPLYRRDPTCPSFLYLSFQRPHPPFDPPAWAFYLSAKYVEPPVGNWADLYAEHRSDNFHAPLVANMH